MAVLGSLFLFLLCGNLLNAARLPRSTSEDEGAWIDDTNTRSVQGQDELSQSTGLSGMQEDEGTWVDDTNSKLVMGDDELTHSDGLSAMSDDEGKWVDDTNTRSVQGQDEQSQATGWTAADEAAAAAVTRRKRFAGRAKKSNKQDKEKDM